MLSPGTSTLQPAGRSSFSSVLIGTVPSDLNSRRDFSWIATSIFLGLSTLSLILRLVVRLSKGGKLRPEDWIILPGYFMALMPAICIYVLLENGLGYHMSNLDAATKKSFLKADFALQRANQPALACIKISILVFYMGIFPTRKFKMAVYANIAYTIVWAVVGWCINLTVCHPVSYFYDRSIPGGYCGSQQVSGAVNGGLGVFGDVMILILPVFMIRKLHLNTRKKIAVSGIFLLGAFVCIASGLRIWAVSQAAPKDVSYAQATASTWTAIEMQVAILSANLPTLAPLFERFLRNRKHTNPPSSGGAYAAGLSGGSTGRRTGPGTSLGANKSVTAYEYSATRSLHRNSKTLAHDGFERISDDLVDTQSNSNSLGDVELSDRAILVKTEMTSKVEARSVQTNGNEVDSYELSAIRGWRRS